MHESLPKISDCTDLRGKRVLVVGGIDVPLQDNEIIETFRLERIRPTIDFLQKSGAKIILVGHIGHDVPESTEPIARYFGMEYVDSLDAKIIREKISTCTGPGIVLRNVRADAREEKNDESFARELASCADIFVNEDFPTSHRNYASIVGFPRFLPSYAGVEFAQEVAALSSALNPDHPSLVILGGAKADTKIPLVYQFADKTDQLFVGGSLANTLFKAKGCETGISLVDGDLEAAKKILEYHTIALPIDVMACAENICLTKSPEHLEENENMLDIGLDTIQELGKEIAKAKFVLWNGPMGVYEKGYREGTESLAKILAESKATTIVGGGDTITAIKKLGLLEKFTFVSIGGGAMIEFLSKGTLPAIEALMKSQRKV